METNLHLPLDHEQWSEYRALKKEVGTACASYMTLRIWVELGYQAQAGKPVGILDAKAQLMVGEGLETPYPEKAVGLLVSTGFLVEKQGEPGVLFCERFSKLNKHLDSSYKPREVWGAEKSKYVRDMRRYEESALQFALEIPESVWEKEDGKQMEHDEIGQVMLLIRGCDNALGKADRQQNNRGFSQTLVRCALAVVKEFTQDQREAILLKLLKARGNPVIPPTTEQLLAVGPSGRSRFSELAPILMKK